VWWKERGRRGMWCRCGIGGASGVPEIGDVNMGILGVKGFEEVLKKGGRGDGDVKSPDYLNIKVWRKRKRDVPLQDPATTATL
jgi:hypothetical protein